MLFIVCLALAFFGGVWAEHSDKQPPAVRTRIPALSDQASAQEPPKADSPVPSPKDEQKEAQYYGSTYWDAVLTSVYFYPDAEGGAVAVPETHLKFDHREDDIWLCGDQRRSFEPGNRYRLLVTFEPNAPCVTNWKSK